MGRKNVHLAVHPAVLPGNVGGPEGSQKAPQGAPDDGSDALQKFAQISSENDLKNEPEIVKKYIQIMAKLFYYVS